MIYTTCVQKLTIGFSLFRDIIGGPKIKNGSRDPDNAPFKGDMSALCWELI